MKQRPMAYFSLYSKKQSLLVVILKNNGHGLGWLTVPMRPKKAKASIQNTFNYFRIRVNLFRKRVNNVRLLRNDIRKRVNLFQYKAQYKAWRWIFRKLCIKSALSLQ